MLRVFDNYTSVDTHYYSLEDYLSSNIKLTIPNIYYDRISALTTIIRYIHISVDCNEKLQAAYFKNLLDGLVYEIYLQDEFIKYSREIFKCLDLIKSGNMKFNNKIVKEEFIRLYDTKHLVRNNLELYDSIQKVREFEFRYRK